MDIKELEAVSGQPARNIRHLISKEVVPEPVNTGRWAAYGEEHVRALAVYTEMRGAGVTSLDVIRDRVRAGAVPAGPTVLNPWPGVEVRVEAAALAGLDTQAVVESIWRSLEAAVRQSEGEKA